MNALVPTVCYDPKSGFPQVGWKHMESFLASYLRTILSTRK